MISQNLLLIPLSIFTLNNIKPLQPLQTTVTKNINTNVNLQINAWEVVDTTTIKSYYRTKTLEKDIPAGHISQIAWEKYQIPKRPPYASNDLYWFSKIVIATKIEYEQVVSNFSMQSTGKAYGDNISWDDENARQTYYYTSAEDAETSYNKMTSNEYSITNDFTEITQTIETYASYIRLGLGEGWQGATIQPEEGYLNINTVENTIYYVEEYTQYYDTENLLINPSSFSVNENFTNIYTKTNLKYTFTIDVGDVEVIDIPDLIFTIIAMPFAFISQAFNLVLFEGTAYAINVSNLVFGFAGVAIMILIIKIIFTLKG